MAIEFQRNIATEPEAERAAFAGHKDFADAQLVSQLITSPDDWNVNVETIFVDATVDRKSAKRALFKISSQGEGVSDEPGSISHFMSLLKLFEAAEQQAPEVIAVEVGKSKDAANKAAQTVMEFFNTRYQMLLLLIDVALRICRTKANRACVLCSPAWPSTR